MEIKIPKGDYAVDWQVFFSDRSIKLLGVSVSDDGVFLRIFEKPDVLQRAEIEAAIIALINKIYWSDDPNATAIFSDPSK